MREWHTDESGVTWLNRPPTVDYTPTLFKHSRHGLPSAFWEYKDEDGVTMTVVARYETAEGKVIVPWIWDGKWIAKHPPAPKMLYGLEKLKLMNPATKILLVEGEKTAEAAQRLFKKNFCVMTWMGGAKGWGKADFKPLANRSVRLWPDADEAGTEAMLGIGAKLLELPALDVWYIDPADLASIPGIAELPKGWDLADAERDGIRVDHLINYAIDHRKELKPPPPKTNGKAVGRLQSLPSPGGQVYEQAAPPDSTVAKWDFYGLYKKGSGVPYSNQSNVGLVLAKRVGLGELEIYYDEFAHRVMHGKEPWTDRHTAQLTNWLQINLGLGDMRCSTVFEGVAAFAHENRRNPPKEWLESLTWDGGQRTLELLPTGLGTRRSAYTEAVGRCFMVGMVARVMNPGCKADCMPVFEGGQGIKKTTMLQIIGGEWFAEVHESMMTKDFYLAISGKMLCEISELNSLKRADVERVKGVLSTAIDRFRAPYGRIAEDIPRGCVFAGTTNKYDWNTDETGARRFWPVRCGTIDVDWLAENREQLFAEAYDRYMKGEQWWDIPQAEAKFEQDARYEPDAWETLVGGFLRNVDETTIATLIVDVMHLKADSINQVNQNRMGKILRRCGFVNRVRRSGEIVERKWVKSEERKIIDMGERQANR